jgi:hypothetical protein
MNKEPELHRDTNEVGARISSTEWACKGNSE